MILVVGGLSAGKQTFVEEQLGYPSDKIASACFDERPVIRDIQLMMLHCAPDELFEHLAKKQVVICTEVGCGVVPVDAQERLWRQQVGRLCCKLAQQADVVVRVYCGIPQVIKGTL